MGKILKQLGCDQTQKLKLGKQIKNLKKVVNKIIRKKLWNSKTQILTKHKYSKSKLTDKIKL